MLGASARQLKLSMTPRLTTQPMLKLEAGHMCMYKQRHLSGRHKQKATGSAQTANQSAELAGHHSWPSAARFGMSRGLRPLLYHSDESWHDSWQQLCRQGGLPGEIPRSRQSAGLIKQVEASWWGSIATEDCDTRNLFGAAVWCRK